MNLMNIEVCTAIIFLWILLFNRYPSVLLHTNAYIPVQTSTDRDWYVLECTTIFRPNKDLYHAVCTRTFASMPSRGEFKKGAKGSRTQDLPHTLCWAYHYTVRVKTSTPRYMQCCQPCIYDCLCSRTDYVFAPGGWYGMACTGPASSSYAVTGLRLHLELS